MTPPPPRSTLFPYTTLFRSPGGEVWPCHAAGRITTLTFENVSVVMRPRSEEHTSELQSRFDLVCRLLLEKKKDSLPSESSDCGVPRFAREDSMKVSRTPYPA